MRSGILTLTLAVLFPLGSAVVLGADASAAVTLRHAPGVHAVYSLSGEGTYTLGETIEHTNSGAVELIVLPAAEDRLLAVARWRQIKADRPDKATGKIARGGVGVGEAGWVMSMLPTGRGTARDLVGGRRRPQAGADALLDLPLPDKPVNVGDSWQAALASGMVPLGGRNGAKVKLEWVKVEEGRQIAGLRCWYTWPDEMAPNATAQATAEFDVARGVFTAVEYATHVEMKEERGRTIDNHIALRLVSAEKTEAASPLAAFAKALDKAAGDIAQNRLPEADQALAGLMGSAPKGWGYVVARLRFGVLRRQGKEAEMPVPPMPAPKTDDGTINACNSADDAKAFAADGFDMSVTRDWKSEGEGALQVTCKKPPRGDFATIVCTPAEMPALSADASLVVDVHSANVQFATFRLRVTDGKKNFTSPTVTVSAGEKSGLWLDLADAAKAGVDLAAVKDVRVLFDTAMFVNPGSVVHLDALRVKPKGK